MNVIEKANEVSIFTRWTQNVAQTTTPWEYGMTKNVPPHTRHYTADSTYDYQPSRQLTWTIPRLGLLKKVVLKVDTDFEKDRFIFFDTGSIGNDAAPFIVDRPSQATHVFMLPPNITKNTFLTAHNDNAHTYAVFFNLMEAIFKAQLIQNGSYRENYGVGDADNALKHDFIS